MNRAEDNLISSLDNQGRRLPNGEYVKRRRLPSGALLFMRIPNDTTEFDVIDAFDRHGIKLSPERIDVRGTRRGYLAIVSVPQEVVAELVNRIAGGDSFFPTGIEPLICAEKREGWPPVSCEVKQ